MTEIKRQPNLIYLNDNQYIVRTQAGFKKLRKHVFKSWELTESDIKKSKGYPESYPSIVTFSGEYRGYFYVTFECEPLLVYIEKAQALLTILDAQ